MGSDNGRSRSQRSLVAAPRGSALAIPAERELQAAARFAKASKSAATRRAYTSDFLSFRSWCAARELEALPASVESVVRYLSTLAEQGKKVSTIRRASAAITYAHRVRGFEPPTSSEAVRAVLSGIRRELGVKPSRKAPVTSDVMRRMMKEVPGNLIGVRDRALLLTGYAGALRRSELVALQVEDLELQAEGLVLHIRRSKTNQEGEAEAIAIPRGGKLGTFEAIQHWMHLASIATGPLFRSVNKAGRPASKGLSAQAVAKIVKRYAARVGLEAEDFAGHSLRAGFVTSAFDAGADAIDVARQTRHRDLRTLRVYDRRTQFQKHAGRKFL